MKLREAIEILEGEVHLGKEKIDQIEVTTAGASDLMSDILNRLATDLLLTGLNTTQVIHTASVSGIRTVVLARGKKPDARMLAAAKQEEIVLLSTPLSLFEASGRLYQKGVHSGRGPIGRQ